MLLWALSLVVALAPLCTAENVAVGIILASNTEDRALSAEVSYIAFTQVLPNNKNANKYNSFF